MANIEAVDPKQLQRSTQSIDKAVSAYEKAMLKKLMKKRNAQRQPDAANDAGFDTLRYLFSIFR